MRSSTLSVATLALIAQSLAAYVPSEPWSTLTPSATLAHATTHYTKTFAISIDPISTPTGSASLAKRDVVTQIGDGQIQATTATPTKAAVVTQIGDGQIQATTHTSAQVATQIGDGQIQATTTADADKAPEPTTPAGDYVFPVSCKSPNALSMVLHDGILNDAHGRVGSIVANRQFQFDGPPPQAGAIYAAGWSVSEEGNLAIGTTEIFYQCLSGSFYNLYDEHIGSQCEPVYLKVVDLIDC